MVSCAALLLYSPRKSVHPGNDEIKGLWRLNPMLGIDRWWIAADQQEPEQVNR